MKFSHTHIPSLKHMFRPKSSCVSTNPTDPEFFGADSAVFIAIYKKIKDFHAY